MKVAGMEVSHPKKVLFPELGITKGDVVAYYERIADRMLPYMKDRPLTLQRFPEGIHQPGFYQKHAQPHYPDYLERVSVKTREGRAEEILCNSKKSLLYLANLSVICFHTWCSRKGSLERPDKVIFDLDPSDNDFAKLRQGARLLRGRLQERGVAPQLMTTGKKGVHLFYSIAPTRDFETVRTEARELAEGLTHDHPELFTLEFRKEKRGSRIFLDTLRNAYGQTGVCPFSLRPEPNAGVATPLDWEELSRVSSGGQYTYTNIFRRLGTRIS